MADTRKITVEIVTKSEDSGSTIIKNEQTNITNNNVSVDISVMLHPLKNARDHILGKSVFLNQAYDIAKENIGSAINLTANRYFDMKEDYIGNTNYKNFMTGVNKLASFGTSLVLGAETGLKFGGVVGAAVGAGIGAVGFGISEVIGYQGRMSNYYSSLNASNYQTAFGRQRAGLVDGGKGTEN